ncbi:helix-turn-helix domain-containing protein [Sinorhizobium meliloti]|uniref:helix-turn-helix domain-containing protein n=1 Tax=Rhizobium meliloti TaxID=382 RepID=UPI0019116EEC|nr:helix-turn-helix domain-containing protein [Sinorhizobium meliloti]
MSKITAAAVVATFGATITSETAHAVFTPGTEVIFQPVTKRGFNVQAGAKATVGPKGVYVGDYRGTEFVDIIWSNFPSQSNGGYYPQDFQPVVEAEPVAQAPKGPVEPTAPMTKAVLELLRRKGAITQMEAQGVLRCRALPRRIADLKALGHNIVRELKVDPTGQRYARYHLGFAA